ncbi:Non-classical phosphatidylinositol transfer protein (PITP) [Rhizina undulata]
MDRETSFTSITFGASDRTSLVSWPKLPPDHPLRLFSCILADLIEISDHTEIWGVKLIAPPPPTTDSEESINLVESQALPPFTTILILQKFLRANGNDVLKALKHLSRTLEWRGAVCPGKLLDIGVRGGWRRFCGVGLVQRGLVEGRQRVMLWFLWGRLGSVGHVVEELEEFYHWRIALQELAVSSLNLDVTTNPIPDLPHPSYPPPPSAVDPHQIIEIHDFSSLPLRDIIKLVSTIKRLNSKLDTVYPALVEKRVYVNVSKILAAAFGVLERWPCYRDEGKDVFMGGGDLVGLLGRTCPREFGGCGQRVPDVGRGS